MGPTMWERDILVLFLLNKTLLLEEKCVCMWGGCSRKVRNSADYPLGTAVQPSLLSLCCHHYQWLQIFQGPQPLCRIRRDTVALHDVHRDSLMEWFQEHTLEPKCMGLGPPSGTRVSQLFKLFMSCFPSSYEVIIWIHFHDHGRDICDIPCADLKWVVLTSSGLLQPISARMMTRKRFTLTECIRARLFLALSSSFPNLGNGESWCYVSTYLRVSRKIQNYQELG